MQFRGVQGSKGTVQDMDSRSPDGSQGQKDVKDKASGTGLPHASGEGKCPPSPPGSPGSGVCAHEGHTHMAHLEHGCHGLQLTIQHTPAHGLPDSLVVLAIYQEAVQGAQLVPLRAEAGSVPAGEAAGGGAALEHVAAVPAGLGPLRAAPTGRWGCVWSAAVWSPGRAGWRVCAPGTHGTSRCPRARRTGRPAAERGASPAPRAPLRADGGRQVSVGAGAAWPGSAPARQGPHLGLTAAPPADRQPGRDTGAAAPAPAGPRPRPPNGPRGLPGPARRPAGSVSPHTGALRRRLATGRWSSRAGSPAVRQRRGG